MIKRKEKVKLIEKSQVVSQHLNLQRGLVKFLESSMHD